MLTKQNKAEQNKQKLEQKILQVNSQLRIILIRILI